MKKTFAAIAIIILAGFFFGCTSASAKNGSGKLSVIHEIKYSNKGSRSEGRSGYLKINGVLLPDCFTKVVADGKIYSFRTKSLMWGNDGYFPDETSSLKLVYPPVNKYISDADISIGWSEVEGHYLNIPEQWIFVKWNIGSAVVSPDKIDALVEAKSLIPIPRNRMFDILKQ